jgi:hypothetical protein
MTTLRGGTHTTLTETAKLVVQTLKTIPGVTKISPGIISQNTRKGGKRHVTGSFTNAGMELIISGQGSQKVAVHCNPDLAIHIFNALASQKKLSAFSFKTRERKPGI